MMCVGKCPFVAPSKEGMVMLALQSFEDDQTALCQHWLAEGILRWDRGWEWAELGGERIRPGREAKMVASSAAISHSNSQARQSDMGLLDSVPHQ